MIFSISKRDKSNYSKLILILILGFIFSTCNSKDSPTLARLEVESFLGSEFLINETEVLELNGFDESGESYDIDGLSVTWTSSNNLASISTTQNTSGLLETGSTEGTVTITATVQDVSVDFEITITDISSQDYHIYISDAGNFQDQGFKIMRFDQNGEFARLFIVDNLAWPQDILFLEERNEVLISSLNSGRITRYNSDTGAYIDNFATGIGGPTRMKIGPDGHIYVLQWQGNGKVLRYQTDGTFIDEFTDVGVTNSIGLDWDSNDNLYVSSFSDGTVTRFNSLGVSQGVFVNSNIAGPTNIWFNENGQLLVNDWSGGKIAVFSASGVYIRDLVTGLNQVEGIAHLDDNSFLIGNGGTSSIKHYSEDGNFIEDIIPARSLGLIQPNAVVLRRLNSQ